MGEVALKDWLFQRLEEAIEIIHKQDLLLEQHGIEMIGGHIAEQRTALLEHLEGRPYFAELSGCIRKEDVIETPHDLP